MVYPTSSLPIKKEKINILDIVILFSFLVTLLLYLGREGGVEIASFYIALFVQVYVLYFLN